MAQDPLRSWVGHSGTDRYAGCSGTGADSRSADTSTPSVYRGPAGRVAVRASRRRAALVSTKPADGTGRLAPVGSPHGRGRCLAADRRVRRRRARERRAQSCCRHRLSPGVPRTRAPSAGGDGVFGSASETIPSCGGGFGSPSLASAASENGVRSISVPHAGAQWRSRCRASAATRFAILGCLGLLAIPGGRRRGR